MTSDERYALAVNFAAHWMLVSELQPDLRSAVSDAVLEAVRLRKGFCGDRVRTDVAREVLEEIAERASRIFAVEFGKRSQLPDNVVERVERELSDTCARALALIRERLP